MNNHVSSERHPKPTLVQNAHGKLFCPLGIGQGRLGSCVMLIKSAIFMGSYANGVAAIVLMRTNRKEEERERHNSALGRDTTQLDKQERRSANTFSEHRQLLNEICPC